MSAPLKAIYMRVCATVVGALLIVLPFCFHRIMCLTTNIVGLYTNNKVRFINLIHTVQ